jgi:type IV fimbrial biogenesis protein FimT
MHSRGFTMIELLVTMTVAAILLMLAVPSYTEFMRNTRIRGTADSIAGGIRLAQTEAIRMNQNIEFVVDPATGWTIRDPITPRDLHTEAFTEGGGQLDIDPSPVSATTLTYSPLGQLFLPNNPDATPALTFVDVRHTMTPSRPLRVITEALGVGVRVCDPNPAVHADLRCP